MSIDLKPINNEVIQKMGLNAHDLWVIKVNDVVYGPFEVESLKDYATENEKEFHEALASRTDTNDWHPFFSHAHFQNISHSEAEKAENITYWVLLKGQKVGPLSRMDIDKKLEMEILTHADFVSIDEGASWKKFYQLQEFNAASASSMNDLPQAPTESSFQRAKAELVERYEDEGHRDDTKIGLAALAHMGMNKEKVSLNLEEIDLHSLSETEISRSLKWAVPSAVAGVGILAFIGYAVMNPYSSDDVATIQNTATEAVVAASGPTHRPSRAPRAIHQRRPASNHPVDYGSRSGLTAPPPIHNEYPTHIETHQNEPDPMVDPIAEAENNPPPEPQEHSLVSNNASESLDQQMGDASAPAEAPPEAPVIEEVTDF